LIKEGIAVPEMSVGSTPTEMARVDYGEITEIRPGNYVFMDRTQLNKGIANYNQISLFVVATIVSLNEHYFIVDAGSKVLSADLAPHCAEGMTGYGEAFGIDDWSYRRNQLPVAKLSEEHGWIKRDTKHNWEIGSKIVIIPNHSCPVANLSDSYVVIAPQETTTWRILARGQVR